MFNCNENKNKNKNKMLPLISLMLIIFILSILFIQNNIYISANSFNYIGTSAKAMCVLEGNTNTTLYAHNENTKLAMASTTKIMTAIVAIENVSDIHEMVSINDKAVGIEGTSIYLQKGEKLSVIELLYGLILASGNDAATALAYHLSSDEDEFAKLMTEKAVEIGATNTMFANSHGLDAHNHYTTANDLALITSYAMKNDVFKEIVSTKQKNITGNEKSGPRYLRNKNRLVFYQPNNVGVKTGFTDNAGRCLVNAVEHNDMMIITVLLNCGPMFEEAKRLTDAVIRNYEMKEFISPYNYVGSIPVNEGDKSKISVVSIKAYKIPILIGEEDKYDIVYDLPDEITAPVNKDEEIGEVRVFYDGVMIFSDELYSIDEVKNVDIKYMLNNILDKWF